MSQEVLDSLATDVSTVEEQPVELEQVVDVGTELSKNVLFVAVTVHWWRGIRKAEEIDVKFGETKVTEEEATSPRWRLMPKEWHDRFSSIEVKLRALVDKAALPFPIRGIDIIPRTKAVELFKAVDAIINGEFMPAVDEFISQWDEMIEKMRQEEPPAMFQEKRSKMPQTAADVRCQFRVTKYVIPISANFAEAYTDQDAALYAQEVVDETREFISKTAQVMADGLQAELSEAVNALIKRVENKDVVRTANLEKVRQLLDKLESFKFLAKPAVLVKLQEARQVLAGLGHADLNRDNRKGQRQLATGLQTVLQSLMSEVDSDSATLGGFGRLRRSAEM